MAKQEKEFDRSICFTYFGNYDRQIELVKEQCGLETAYEVYRAIVDYGLFKKEITDPKIRMLVGEATLDLIENSQKKRENSFGENIEQTQTIIDYNREHPEASQREIARVTGISQGKVNKVFKKYELKTIKKSSKDTDSDNVTDNDIDDDYDNDSVNVNVNVTQCHTKDASHDASLNNGAEAPTTTAEQEEKELTYEEKMFIYSKKEKVWDLFDKHVKPKEISKQTGFDMKFVNSAIDEYRANGDKKPDPPKNMLIIPTIDNDIYKMDLNEFDPNFENNEEAKDLYDIFIDPNGNYKFEPEFTAKWFKDSYGMEV